MTAAVRAPERRPVRVTIDGEAYQVAAGVLMVVRQDGSKLVVAEGPGVTVEHVEPPRVWTDGDVVQTDNATYDRCAGSWRNTSHLSPRPDHDIEVWVKIGAAKVLRYQHGGDQ